MKLSKSANNLKPSATLAINELISKKRANGQEIYHMGFGESPFPVHPLVSEALCKNADKKSYLPVQGLLQLRERISNFYIHHFNLSFTPEHIIVGPGSKMLILSALSILEGPLLLPAPSWVSYQHQARFTGKEVYHILTDPNNSYRLTVENLEEIFTLNSIREDTQKVLLINYPCNPTGHSYSTSQLRELASFAREHSIIVLSDEIYALTNYKGTEHHSISEFYPEGTLLTGGISKDRSLGGYRLGVMLLPKEEEDLKQVLTAFGSESWSSVSAPIQYAAIEAYSTSNAIGTFIKECAEIHEIMTSYIHRRLEKCGVRCSKPQGAFYLLPDWNHKKESLEDKQINTSAKLSKLLLDEWNLASLPGSEFGMPEDDLCIRLASVDYDGEEVLNAYRKSPETAWKDPEGFIMKNAPRIYKGSNQLELFSNSLI